MTQLFNVSVRTDSAEHVDNGRLR